MMFKIEAIRNEEDYARLTGSLVPELLSYKSVKVTREACVLFLLENASDEALVSLCTMAPFLSEQFPDVFSQWHPVDQKYHHPLSKELGYFAITSLKRRCELEQRYHPCVNGRLSFYGENNPAGILGATHAGIMDAVNIAMFDLFHDLRKAVVLLHDTEKIYTRKTTYSCYKNPANEAGPFVKHVIETIIDDTIQGKYLAQMDDARKRVIRITNTLLSILPDPRIKAIQYGKIIGRLDSYVGINKSCCNWTTRLMKGKYTLDSVRSAINRQYYDNLQPLLYLRHEICTLILDAYHAGMAEQLFPDVIEKLSIVASQPLSQQVHQTPANHPDLSVDPYMDETPQHLIERALYGHETLEPIEDDTDTIHLKQDAHLPSVLQQSPIIRIKKKRPVYV